MRLSDVSSSGVPATPATRGTSASVRAGAGFGALYSEVNDGVSDFIRNGSSEPAWSADVPAYDAPALSAEGQAHRALRPAAGVASPGAPVEAQQEFLEAVAPWAEETGQRLGVAPHIVAAHAALESGWGQKPLRQADGSDTNNLFGIKAGGGWQGEVAQALTTEYQDGVALKKVERFRSYPDAGGSFRDYAQLLIDNPRYHAALNAGSDAKAFAEGLARGGYATDPAYAEKLSRLASRLQPGASARPVSRPAVQSAAE